MDQDPYFIYTVTLMNWFLIAFTMRRKVVGGRQQVIVFQQCVTRPAMSSRSEWSELTLISLGLPPLCRRRPSPAADAPPRRRPAPLFCLGGRLLLATGSMTIGRRRPALQTMPQR